MLEHLDYCKLDMKTILKYNPNNLKILENLIEKRNTSQQKVISKL